MWEINFLRTKIGLIFNVFKIELKLVKIEIRKSKTFED